MIKSFSNALHPAFESLSAFADEEAGANPETRVARHVQRCESCAITVNEIRSFGSAARAIVAPPAPADLRTRIESAARAGQWATHAAAAPAMTLVAPPAYSPSGRRIMLGLAAAAAVLAIVALPSHRSLQASGVNRLTFSPGRPAPGAMLDVRYTPAPWLKGAPRLILVGRYSLSDMRAETSYWQSRSLLGDSLATLRLASDGAYETALRLPSDFRSLEVAVVDSLGEAADGDGPGLWTIVGGTRSGAPSLASFTSWLWWHDEWKGFRAAYDLNVGPSVRDYRAKLTIADSLTKYFPEHPLGWAMKRDYGVKKGLFDYFRFFDTAERKYAGFYEKLMPKPSLDAERLHDMALFAMSIDEPEHAALWVKRLVREHPEDPRALGDLAEMLHQLELAYPKSAADSVRRWIPLLDSLYVHSSPHLIPQPVFSIVQRYATAEQNERWRHRALSEGNTMSQWSPAAGNVEPTFPSSYMSAGDRARFHELASRPCAIPAGRYPIYGDRSLWLGGCIAESAYPLSVLATDALERGDARLASVLADSSVQALAANDPCVAGRASSLEIRARARVALGNRAGATDDLVKMFAGAGGGGSLRSVRALAVARSILGPNVDSARFVARTDSALAAWLSCRAARAPAVNARQARSRARWSM